MQIILLSGGSGKRLWPLSNEINSKQFIKIFRAGQESMLQRVLKQIRKVAGEVPLTIATSKTQEAILKKYIDAEISVAAEPCRRNTFPAIAMTALFLRDVKKIAAAESIVICPVDSYAADEFFQSFKKMAELVQNDAANLILLGINPTYPSEKYGYIIPASAEKICAVLEFKEKPDLATARRYLEKGGGMERRRLRLQTFISP